MSPALLAKELFCVLYD